MQITIYYENELEVINLPIEQVETYVNLLKKYGYSDIEGNDYKFKSAQIENSVTMTVYLDESRITTKFIETMNPKPGTLTSARPSCLCPAVDAGTGSPSYYCTPLVWLASLGCFSAA